MATNRVLRLVMVSPSDVQEERERLRGVVEELNTLLAQINAQVTLQCFAWEDVTPALHEGGPQAHIDTRLPLSDCEYLIGIFWHRLGTPGPDGASGSEHEIRLAEKSWKSKGRPEIMLYFKTAPYLPKTVQETEQWGRLLQFKDDMKSKGLIDEVISPDLFEKRVRFHLLTHLLSEKTTGVSSTIVGRNLSFWPTARPRFIRAEGQMELIGDIEIFTRCLGPVEETELPDSFTVRVALNNIITNPTSPDGSTDAVLVIDKTTVIRGRRINEYSLAFVGIPRDALWRQAQPLLMTNIYTRANWGERPDNRGAFDFDIARVSLESPDEGGSQLHDSKTVAVAGAVMGYLFQWSGVPGKVIEVVDFNALSSEGRNENLAADPSFTSALVTAKLKFSEVFPHGFRTKEEEAGWTAPGIQPATCGTRLLARFYGVPRRVKIFVTTRDLPPTEERIENQPSPDRKKSCVKAVLVSGANLDGTGGTPPQADTAPSGTGITTAGIPISRVPIEGGTGFAVWEWVSKDPKSTETRENVSFGVVVAVPRGEKIEWGFIRVQGDLAPVLMYIHHGEGRRRISSNYSIPCFLEHGDDPKPLVYFSRQNGCDSVE